MGKPLEVHECTTILWESRGEKLLVLSQSIELGTDNPSGLVCLMCVCMSTDCY